MVVWALVVFMLMVALATVVFSGYVGWRLTHPARKPFTATPLDYGMNHYHSIRFTSRGGDETLDGWHIPAQHVAQPRATVVFSHGYAGNRLEEGLPALALAQSLVEEGYDVVLYDFRNCGRSTGSLTSVGYHEQRDVLGAVDWAKANGANSVFLLGFSMGATSSLLAAAQDNDVVAVIADSPFSHLTRYLRRNLPVWTKLPNFPFTPLILTILPPLTGTHPNAVDAEAAVERIYPRPILFVHSSGDGAIPASHSIQLAARHPDRFELWQTEGGVHVGSYRSDPGSYTQRVLMFLATHRV